MELSKRLKKSLKNIVDIRQSGKVLHPLSDIILTALFTFLSNGEDYADMVLFGENHGSKLKQYLRYPHGVPSAETFRVTFSWLNPSDLIGLLKAYSEYFIDILSEKQIVIDGKSIRGCKGVSGKEPCLHLVSAWVSENGFCVGQVAVSDKSNEITAVPELLKKMDISGSIVSLDAMGTQREIAQQICGQGGDYLMALKGNQGELFREVKAAFELSDTKVESSGWIMEENGGRKEGRKCSILAASGTLPAEMTQAWTSLTTLVKVERVRKGVETQHYYISSEKTDDKINNPLYFNHLVRDHWSIENKLHWTLDVVFREDNAKVKLKNAAQNLAILRKLATQILQNAKSFFKLSIQKMRYIISLDINNLCKLFDFSYG